MKGTQLFYLVVSNLFFEKSDQGAVMIKFMLFVKSRMYCLTWNCGQIVITYHIQLATSKKDSVAKKSSKMLVSVEEEIQHLIDTTKDASFDDCLPSSLDCELWIIKLVPQKRMAFVKRKMALQQRTNESLWSLIFLLLEKAKRSLRVKGIQAISK